MVQKMPPSAGKRHRGSSLTDDKKRKEMLMKRLRIQGSFFLIRLPRMPLKAREREAVLGGERDKRYRLFKGQQLGTA